MSTPDAMLATHLRNQELLAQAEPFRQQYARMQAVRERNGVSAGNQNYEDARIRYNSALADAKARTVEMEARSAAFRNNYNARVANYAERMRNPPAPQPPANVVTPSPIAPTNQRGRINTRPAIGRSDEFDRYMQQQARIPQTPYTPSPNAAPQNRGRIITPAPPSTVTSEGISNRFDAYMRHHLTPEEEITFHHPTTPLDTSRIRRNIFPDAPPSGPTTASQQALETSTRRGATLETNPAFGLEEKGGPPPGLRSRPSAGINPEWNNYAEPKSFIRQPPSAALDPLIESMPGLTPAEAAARTYQNVKNPLVSGVRNGVETGWVKSGLNPTLAGVAGTVAANAFDEHLDAAVQRGGSHLVDSLLHPTDEQGPATYSDNFNLTKATFGSQVPGYQIDPELSGSDWTTYVDQKTGKAKQVFRDQPAHFGEKAKNTLEAAFGTRRNSHEFKAAGRAAQQAIDKYGRENVELVGSGLGGSKAAFASSRTKASAEVFNANAGLDAWLSKSKQSDYSNVKFRSNAGDITGGMASMYKKTKENLVDKNPLKHSIAHEGIGIVQHGAEAYGLYAAAGLAAATGNEALAAAAGTAAFNEGLKTVGGAFQINKNLRDTNNWSNERIAQLGGTAAPPSASSKSAANAVAPWNPYDYTRPSYQQPSAPPAPVFQGYAPFSYQAPQAREEPRGNSTTIINNVSSGGGAAGGPSINAKRRKAAPRKGRKRAKPRVHKAPKKSTRKSKSK